MPSMARFKCLDTVADLEVMADFSAVARATRELQDWSLLSLASVVAIMRGDPDLKAWAQEQGRRLAIAADDLEEAFMRQVMYDDCVWGMRNLTGYCQHYFASNAADHAYRNLNKPLMEEASGLLLPFPHDAPNNDCAEAANVATLLYDLLLHDLLYDHLQRSLLQERAAMISNKGRKYFVNKMAQLKLGIPMGGRA